MLAGSPVHAMVAPAASSTASGLQAPPVATFKTGVDLVRVAAVVRDDRGRFVDGLTAGDFQVLESGAPRPIASFQQERTAVSVEIGRAHV